MLKEINFSDVKCDEATKECKIFYGLDNSIQHLPFLQVNNTLGNEIMWKNKLGRTVLVMEEKSAEELLEELS